MSAPFSVPGFESQTFSSNVGKGRMGFSGCDINAIIRLPGYKSKGQELNQEKVFRIGTLQTIAISTYNSKTPVKALGFKNPIAIARGGRTIAGTLIFNQLHTHVFDDNSLPSLTRVEDDGLLTYSTGKTDLYISPSLRRNPGAPESTELPKDKDKMKKQWDFSWDNTLFGERSKPSDIPPFDIVILLVNELGNVGKIVLYGVDIVHDSQTLSVEDIYTEVQYQFMAREIEYFHAHNFEEARSWSSAASPTVTNTEAKIEAANTNPPEKSPVEIAKEAIAKSGTNPGVSTLEDVKKTVTSIITAPAVADAVPPVAAPIPQTSSTATPDAASTPAAPPIVQSTGTAVP